MKKDVPQLKVENLAIAIVPPKDELIPDFWDAYLINLYDEAIGDVMVVSKGYLVKNDSRKETTTLRQFFDEIGPLHDVKIEPIDVNLFNLAHEFWVSFKLDNYMYDKRYVFVPGTLHKDNFIRIPFLEQDGVMIR